MCNGVHGTTRMHIMFCPSTGMHTLLVPGHACGCFQDIVGVELGLPNYAFARNIVYSIVCRTCSVDISSHVCQFE